MSKFDEAEAALDNRDWSGAHAVEPSRTASVVHSVRMSQDLTERLFAETQRRGITPSELIRVSVEAGLTAVGDDATVTLRVADLRRAIDTVVQHAA